MDAFLQKIVNDEDVLKALLQDETRDSMVNDLVQQVDVDQLVEDLIEDSNSHVSDMIEEVKHLDNSIAAAKIELEKLKKGIQALSSNVVDITGSDDDDDLLCDAKSNTDLPTRTLPGFPKPPLNATHLKYVPRHKRQEEIPQPLAVGCKMFGHRPPGQWLKGTVVEVIGKGENLFKQKVIFKYDNHKFVRHLKMTELSYVNHPLTKLPEGTRCIAHYRDYFSTNPNDNLYLGIVAESPVERNRFRYLIFFDDGYTQYCLPDVVHQVYLQRHHVWEDLPADSAEFVKEYLCQYPDRPMVKLSAGQTIKTEWKGQWFKTRVADVDASLVRLFFAEDHRYEWIYRGSTRLEPLYRNLRNAERARQAGSTKVRRTAPTLSHDKPRVVYERPEPEKAASAELAAAAVERSAVERSASPAGSRQVARKTTNTVRSTARKSGSSQRSHREPPVKDYLLSTSSLGECRQVSTPSLKGDHTAKDGASVQRQSYVSHSCGPGCVADLERQNSPDQCLQINPLLVPMLFGWRRELERKSNASRPHTYYRAPCGRRCRNEQEVDRFLFLSSSKLTIDLFSFDMGLHTHTEFLASGAKYRIKDMTHGLEPVPVECINSLSEQEPEHLDYSAVRIPTSGVNINTDPNFLVCCDCEDDCRDSEKCACRRLTVESSAAAKGRVDKQAGYRWRRLSEPQITGVYECNSKCSCSKKCHNRVVQLGLRVRLQVYKTERKGWGVRCIDDIPAGGFICCYVGEVRTEQMAEVKGKQFGDEYQAELDHIEVVEREKLDTNLPSDEGISDDPSEDSETDNDSLYSVNVKACTAADVKEGARTRTSDRVQSMKLLRSSSNEGGCSRRSTRSVSSTGHVSSSDADVSACSRSAAPVEQSAASSTDALKAEAAASSTESVGVNEARMKARAVDKSPLTVQSYFNKEEIDMEWKLDEDRQPSRRSQLPLRDSSSVKHSHGDDSSDTDVACEESGPPADVMVGGPSASDIEDEGLGLQIIDPTSLNIEGAAREDESGRDSAGVSAKESRFSQLPDPRKLGGNDTKSAANTGAKLEAAGAAAASRKPDDDAAGEDGKDSLDNLLNSFVSTRTLLSSLTGKDEGPYIMDAKRTGNVGRYLNHSCEPNAFVQSVFVDTHDLRYPWVAFFASEHIRAGTELTWDYSYVVGSVPDKRLDCYCDAGNNCRGRLL